MSSAISYLELIGIWLVQRDDDVLGLVGRGHVVHVDQWRGSNSVIRLVAPQLVPGNMVEDIQLPEDQRYHGTRLHIVIGQ